MKTLNELIDAEKEKSCISFDLLANALKAAISEAERFDCGIYVEEAIREILEGRGEK